jgi:putative ABC transport system permease protein
MGTAVWRDIRIAARGFANNPGFTLLAILALGLGIGSSTAMFSVIDHAVLNPFPYADSRRMMVIQIHDLAGSIPGGRTYFTAPEFLVYAERNHVFDRVIASTFEDVLYRTGEGTEQFDGRLVTPDTFEFLGIPAMMGRGLIPDDGQPGAPPVFVMRYKLWAGRFRSDPGILNRTFILNGVPRTLVGVMPPSFAWSNGDLWIPQAITRGDAGMLGGVPRYHFLLGHLRRGVSEAEADAELTVLARQVAAVYPRDYPKQFTVRVASLGCGGGQLPGHAVDGDGGGGPVAADRMRQRGEPAVGPRHGP